MPVTQAYVWRVMAKPKASDSVVSVFAVSPESPSRDATGKTVTDSDGKPVYPESTPVQITCFKPREGGSTYNWDALSNVSPGDEVVIQGDIQNRPSYLDAAAYAKGERTFVDVRQLTSTAIREKVGKFELIEVVGLQLIVRFFMGTLNRVATGKTSGGSAATSSGPEENTAAPSWLSGNDDE